MILKRFHLKFIKKAMKKLTKPVEAILESREKYLIYDLEMIYICLDFVLIIMQRREE